MKPTKAELDNLWAEACKEMQGQAGDAESLRSEGYRDIEEVRVMMGLSSISTLTATLRKKGWDIVKAREDGRYKNFLRPPLKK